MNLRCLTIINKKEIVFRKNIRDRQRYLINMEIK